MKSICTAPQPLTGTATLCCRSGPLLGAAATTRAGGGAAHPCGHAFSKGSIRMRRTSRTVSGLPWVEWPECSITSSDSTPSMWALLYSTTPSLRVSSGPSCSVGMIEWAWMPGATGMARTASIAGLPGDMPAMLLKVRRSLPSFSASPALVRMSAVALAMVNRQRHQPAEQADDGQTGLVAAAMRRGDEDHRLDEGQRMDEQRLLQQRLGLRLQVQLIHRPVADRVPEPRAGVDGDQLGQQPALAVADHHHAAERGIGLHAAEGLDGVFERMAQHVGRDRDRIAGVVGEEPELVMVADFLVFHQVVDHVGPAERAGGGAMHQHHRDAAVPVRLQREQMVLGVGSLGSSAHC